MKAKARAQGKRKRHRRQEPPGGAQARARRRALAVTRWPRGRDPWLQGMMWPGGEHAQARPPLKCGVSFPPWQAERSQRRASQALGTCGTPTAGGVISTGSARIMDAGSLRLPFRGWYGIQSGLDMELNGATPHHIVWPQPGETAQGVDRQLAKAVEVLQGDVKTWLARPRPKLQKASERKFE